jgi:leucine dehydrogenase
VHTDETGLAAAVARGLLRCVETCAAIRGVAVAGLTVAVQGAGAIGAAVTRALTAAGARVLVADLDTTRALALAQETGASLADPAAVLTLPVDLVAPCALGGAIDTDVAESLRAWAVCGAANNLLASPDAEELLVARGVLVVPDAISSAGAVIEGIGRTVMNLPDRTPLIDALGATARLVLDEAAATKSRPTAVATRLALRTVHRTVM